MKTDINYFIQVHVPVLKSVWSDAVYSYYWYKYPVLLSEITLDGLGTVEIDQHLHFIGI